MNESSNVASDNKLIYELRLNSKDLGLVNPYLFVESLRDKIFIKLPSIKVTVFYNTKGKGEPLANLKFFSSDSTSNYQIKKLQKEITFIASTLKGELIDRIEAAQRSVA
jgi:hypothetical protein